MTETELQKAIRNTEKAAKTAGARLQELWNPEKRRYENPDEVNTLHDIINNLVSVRFALNEMERNQ